MPRVPPATSLPCASTPTVSSTRSEPPEEEMAQVIIDTQLEEIDRMTALLETLGA